MADERTARHARHATAPGSPKRRRIIWVLALGATLMVLAGGIVAGGVLLGKRLPVDTPAPTPQAIPNSEVPQPMSSSPPAAPGSNGLAADFAALQTRLRATLGLMLRPVGSGQSSPMTFGTWRSGPAWSTIKVPLVIAAMRQQGSGQVTQAMRAAITASDNAAAESIWAGLGDPVTAAGKVDVVLRDTGNDPTNVQSQRVRPPFTAFGQTDWQLTNQVRFLAAAACDGDDAPVLTLMGHIESDQQWGLGVVPGTKFKGGWGPSTSGAYLVRQMGILPTPNGSTIVAMAAEPQSGSFADGAEDLTAIAHWLQAHLAALPAGQC